MRQMSFAKTTTQILNKTKRVTRRLGWFDLEPGQKVQGIEKGQGLKKGEKVKKLHVIIIEKVTPEPLEAIHDYPNDCELEGFPDMDPEEFVQMFVDGVGGGKIDRQTTVARIQFRYESTKRKRKQRRD